MQWQVWGPHEDGSSGDHMTMAFLGNMRWQLVGSDAVWFLGTMSYAGVKLKIIYIQICKI